MTITLVDSGLVFRNPTPHLRALHAWHPSLVVNADRSWCCSFDLAQAAEAMDYRTWLAQSSDAGRTWTSPRRLLHHEMYPDAPHTVRLTRLRDGQLVAIGAWFHGRDPEQGLLNRANLGFCSMQVILSRSHDGGQSFTPARNITPPLRGPAFEVCHPVLALHDGRWLWPTQTWRGWDGDEPHGMKAIALVSYDQGQTWPQYLDLINQYDRGIWTWEVSLVQMPDGQLIALGWSYHEAQGRSLPNVFASSIDGETFSHPRPVGLQGETAKLCPVSADELLCVYRRVDQPGLWAARLGWRRQEITVLEQAPLWQGGPSLVQGAGNPSDNLSGLRFGYPQIAALGDGRFAVVFWCLEDQVQVIRWITLRLT